MRSVARLSNSEPKTPKNKVNAGGKGSRFSASSLIHCLGVCDMNWQIHSSADEANRKFNVSNGAGWVRDLVAAPFIYSMVVPIACLDLCLGIYQAVCFRVWRIPAVKRTDYVRTDRLKLSGLRLLDRLNCAYCDYANGVFAYAREIGARTEQYWCPIKNAARNAPHERYAEFAERASSDQFVAVRAEARSGLCETCTSYERACQPFLQLTREGVDR